MTSLLKTQAVLVEHDGGRVIVRRRLGSLGVTFAAIVAVGFAFLGLSRVSDEFAGVGLWGAVAVLGVSAALPFKMLYLWWRGPTVITQGVFEGAPHLQTTELAGIRMLELRIGGARVIEAVPVEHMAEMKAVLSAVQDVLAVRGDVTVRPLDRVAAAHEQARLVSLILLVVGLAWAAAGYIAVPDLVLTKHGLDFGFLFWPLGLWIAGAAPLLPYVATFGPLQRGLALLGWLAPYFVLFYRA